MPKMRVLKWIVQPVVVADDGENLTEQEVRPTAIPAADWEAWAAGGWKASVEQLRQAVEGPEVPAQREDGQ